MYIYTYLPLSLSLALSLYIYMYKCIYICICIYINIYIYIYIYALGNLDIAFSIAFVAEPLTVRRNDVIVIALSDICNVQAVCRHGEYPRTLRVIVKYASTTGVLIYVSVIASTINFVVYAIASWLPRFRHSDLARMRYTQSVLMS